MSAAYVYIQVHFSLDFFVDANNMNPDQTPPKEEEGVWSGSILFAIKPT